MTRDCKKILIHRVTGTDFADALLMILLELVKSMHNNENGNYISSKRQSHFRLMVDRGYYDWLHSC